MQSTSPKMALRSEERGISLRKRRLHLAPSYGFRREYYDAIFEHRYLFEMQLRVAELRHRHDLGDPQPPLSEAAALSLQLARLWRDGSKLQDSYCPNGKPYTGDGELWEKLPKGIDAVFFRFGAAAVISLLLHEEIPSDILDVVPRIERWDSARVVSPLNYPDAGLVEVINSKRRPFWWSEMLDFIRESYGGRDLLPRAMECYAEIVLACHDENWRRAKDAVCRAEELYLLRGEGVFDEFESWEGGGAGNSLSIDLRLSALMRHCFKKNPHVLDDLGSVHRWRSK